MGVLVGEILDFCKAKKKQIIEEEIMWWYEQIDHYSFEEIEKILEIMRDEKKEREYINNYLGYEKLNER